MVGVCMLEKLFHTNDRKIEGIRKKKIKNEGHNTKKKKPTVNSYIKTAWVITSISVKIWQSSIIRRKNT